MFFSLSAFSFFFNLLFSFLLEGAEARVSPLLLSFFLLVFCLVCFFFLLFFFAKEPCFSSLLIVLLHFVACYALRCLFLGARKRVLSTRRVLLGSFNKIFVARSCILRTSLVWTSVSCSLGFGCGE
jgi:hypothetical protein